MAEIVLERWTRCPTGRPEDETSFEVILEDDSPLGAKDSTARVTRLARLYTRGDARLMQDRGHERDCLLTVGRGADRTIVAALRVTGLAELDLSALGLTITWASDRARRGRDWEYHGGPARGDEKPAAGTRLDAWRASAPRPRAIRGGD